MVAYANELPYLADLPFVKDRLLSWRFTTAQDLEGTPNITTSGTLTNGEPTLTRVTTATKVVASSRVIVPIWKVSNLANQRGTVTIYASTDGGTTYPYLLTSGQKFLLPAATTSLKFAIDITPNLLQDNFNRANASLSVSTTTTSNDTWQGGTGSWSISSQTLTNNASGSTIYLTSTASSTLFQCDHNYQNSSNTQGWLWRFQDINNFFYLQHNNASTVVTRRLAGGDTTIATVAGVATGATANYSVTNNPATGLYTLSRNGTPIVSNTDLNLASAGGVGILTGVGTTAGFHDNVLSQTGVPVQLEYFGVYLES